MVTTQQQSLDPQQRELLRVCRIGRAQGLRGEVNVQVFTDAPEERFASGSVLFNQTGTREFTVLHARTYKQRWILTLEGVDDRTAAEALNGTELYVEADSAEELAQQDAWYLKDLIGLSVLMAANNQLGAPAGYVVGTVDNVLDGAAQTLLSVRLSEESSRSITQSSAGAQSVPTETLIPFIELFVPQVEVADHYLTIDPPMGLIEGLTF